MRIRIVRNQLRPEQIEGDNAKKMSMQQKIYAQSKSIYAKFAG